MSAIQFIYISTVVALLISILAISRARGPRTQAALLRILGGITSLLSAVVFAFGISQSSVSNLTDWVKLASFQGGSLPLFSLNNRDALLGLATFLVTAAGLIGSPRRALESRTARGILPLLSLLFLLLTINHIGLGLLLVLLIYLGIARLTWIETIENISDDRANGRCKMFWSYHLVALPLLCFALLRHILTIPSSVTDTPESLEALGLAVVSLSRLNSLSLLVSIGIIVGSFPFHSWALSFLSAPRLNPLVQTITTATGMTLLLKYVLPICGGVLPFSEYTLWASGLGLVFFSLLLLVENRLKRIAALLYLIQLALLTIELSLEGIRDGKEAMFLVLNITLANGGLALAMSCLRARFGQQGLISQAGLFTFAPEIGVCFLICMLSLVGFPGTLGFIEGELLVDLVTRNIWVLCCVALAVAMNGYSVFRIFGRAFFGGRSSDDLPLMPLLLREKIALFFVVGALILTGVVPQLLVQLMSSS